MTRNRNKRALSLLLALCLAVLTALPVLAAEEEGPVVSLRSAQDIFRLAESCREDAYSRGLTVSLDADIDLEGAEFEGIPSFSGTFLGNGHTIQGFRLVSSGSTQGFFRYLTQTAQVQELNLLGSVAPDGTRARIGGLAGSNSGLISRCTFQGQVEGNESVGGLVGTNRVAGIIEDCTTKGQVTGGHFVGGVVGENLGTVRGCVSHVGVNLTASDNSIPLSQINRSTIFSTESANTVTDVGGIAGCSSGVIRSCVNHGTVGYQHMGYNIGGIAGSQKGTIANCQNHGKVFGRKEVAGIVGQMEPVTNVEYTADTLQILQRQLQATSALASQASANAHNSAQEVSDQMNVLNGQAGDAAEAVHQLLPQEGEGLFPDEDRVQAAKNSLNGSLSSMQGTMGTIVSTTQDGFNTVTGDIQAVAGQISAMSQTLNHASDHMGVNIKDISDQDTEEDQSGKVVDCWNAGPVSGDLNVGGVAGVIAWENDLDHEEDVQFTGSRSMNASGEVRAVVLRSGNSDEISAKKKGAGGVVGRVLVGLVKDCQNTGTLQAKNADFVGGIAGESRGTLRGCAVKCALLGHKAVGGIAGSATFAADCRSIVSIREGSEQLGAVLGSFDGDILDPQDALTNNVYLDAGIPCGGVDGISYEKMAQSLSLGDFQALPELQPMFAESHVTFKDGDTIVGEATVPLGQMIQAQDLPELPQKKGQIAKWETPPEAIGSGIYLDTVLTAEYTADRTVVESSNTRENGMPILLVEGRFEEAPVVQLQPLEELPTEEKITPVEGWLLPHVAFENGTKIQLRYAYPQDEKQRTMDLMVRDDQGNWSRVPFTVNGSYLVFSPDQRATAFCLVRQQDVQLIVIVIVGVVAAAMVLLCGGMFLARKRKEKPRKAKAPKAKKEKPAKKQRKKQQPQPEQPVSEPPQD